MGEAQFMELVKDGTADVNEACQFLSIGRSRLYELMTRGDVAYLKVGARRLIPREELRRFLARQMAR